MEPRDQSTDSIPQPSAPAPASPHSDSTPRPQRSASPKETPASEDGEIANADPPLPDEEAPPLPDEAPPQDDGWEPLWDQNAGAYYFYNHLTGVSQWENPRVPDATAAVQASYTANSAAPGVVMPGSSGAPGTSSPPRRRAGGYNPAIHGSYDPNADYAKATEQDEDEVGVEAAIGPGGVATSDQTYAATARFNRFTGRFQDTSLNPENHSDEAKSRRQMSAFFDVDAAASGHDGRSLKEERRRKQLSKKEVKAFKDKRREKKEEKRRAWLRD